ncbi:MAG: hypothetical protein PHY93_11605 [Bacteriovorax sp.]|nr:hypothetical protein [Bacteriovorax sp.]
MKKLLIILIATLSLHANNSQAAKLEDYLDRKEVQRKIREAIADQDIKYGVDLANIDLIDGINLSTRYNYNVEASYINKSYSRIDKWDVKTGINVGEILKSVVDVPFSFSVNRNSSFFFVRQFQKKKDAIKAIPYTPAKLPLNAKKALENLQTGDFVSMPANLSVAVGLQASSSMVSPLLVSANAGVYYVLSGEFTIQVFKIDDAHVRLKLLTKRGREAGAKGGVALSFNLFGIKILDHQIERLFERDLVQLGYSYNPGAQFILDYVFDLKNKEAQEAYNQIINSTFKFKDLVVADMIDAHDLKDKLISSYEKADALAAADQKLEPKERRIQRIFKGFNNYQGHTRHLKFSLLITAYTKDSTFTESKVTFIDKKENNLEFYYPTYSKYIESHFGDWFFDLKDQSSQNNFGLIPRFNLEDSKVKNPDLGLTFERKDQFFTPSEQRTVERFMIAQIPAVIAKNIDFSGWRNGVKKIDSRIFFQLVLKSQGFDYLKNIPVEVLKKKILLYVQEKRILHVIDENEDDSKLNKLKDFLFINRYVEKERLFNLAKSLTQILKLENSEEMLKRLVGLNEFGIFDKIGVGFLISLLPQDKLEDLIYLKLEMIGKDILPITAEFGTLNYRVLYNELTQIQSRLSNRGYDLRLSDEDRNMSDLDIEVLPN